VWNWSWDVIEVGADVGPVVGQLDASRAEPPEPDLKGVDRLPDFLLGVDHPEVLVQVRGRQHVGVGGVVDRHPGIRVEGRLRVEALHRADAADEEQPDDRLGLGGEVRLAVGRGPGAGGGPDDPVPVEHGPEGEPGEPEPGVGEKGAAMHRAPEDG
jgi:hypothetical protein